MVGLGKRFFVALVVSALALSLAPLTAAAAVTTHTGTLADSIVGTPAHTIAWGHSLGGIITGGLLQTHSNRFDAALPMCGVVAGGVAVWNEGLDAEFVIKQLLAPSSSVQLVHITNPNNLN